MVFNTVGSPNSADADLSIYEFIQLKFTDYLFGRVTFVFIDTSVSAALTAMRYLTVMALFGYFGYILQILLNKKKTAVQ